MKSLHLGDNNKAEYMILVFLLLIPWLLVSMWWFFRPKSIIRQAERFKRQNRAVVLLASTGILIVSYYFWRTTGQSVDRAWWPILAMMASLFWLCVLFTIGALLRHVRLRHDRTR